ncbi:MAG: VanZ family protein, partial [Azonexus sp.]|nr:VanZ family protein [Azonexus sp.]
MNARGPILLARYLALAWCGLVVYGSLHPFSGWRVTGISPLAFLDGGWPRYWTVFDLLANVAVYLPLGFFLTLALKGLPGRFSALCVAILLAAGVSFGLETLQNWLPSRVPSNVDLVCNTLGGLLGAVVAQILGPRVFARILALEQRLIAPVPHAELGLTLLGLWLLVPLSPEILLFGAGDLRQLIGFSSDVPFVAESFVMIEASVTAFNAIAVGLILRLL